MSDRETLLSTLPEELHDDAAKLYESSSESDPHEVIAELHRRGQLRDDQVRTAVLELESTLRVGRLRSKPPADPNPSILGPLGQGAMGEVLLAKDESLNRVVAIKRLLPELAARPAIAERFYREAQITAQLDHPSIVPIHGLYPGENGSLSYTMKLVRGRTFEDYLNETREQWTKAGCERGEHVLSARLERFLHVCDAVAYAHERGVVHRDLKPENVMVGSFGQVQVMDWGIAKVLAQPKDTEADGSGTGLHSNKMHSNKMQGTRVGSVFGTPRYMSPEQAQGQNDKIDGRSDQYALGLILFELVTLKPAVSAALDVNGCLEWAKAGRKQPMAHFHRKGPVPRELVAIVNKATELKAERRYASVAAMAEDIRRYLRDEEVSAKRDTMLQRLQRWVGRHRSTVVALGMLSVLMFVGALSMLGFAALGTLEWRRRVAAAHEDTVTALLGQAEGGAGRVDEVVRTAEKGLVGLAYAVEATLERVNLTVEPKEDEKEDKYNPCDAGPLPRARESEVYGKKIRADRLSFRHTSCTVPADEGDVLKLASVPYAFLQALLDSASAEEPLKRQEQFKQVANEEGTPIRWAKFATIDGMLAIMPGTENVPSAPPATGLPWYRGDRSTKIVWSGPTMDPDGVGLVLTATRPVFARQKQDMVLKGVAAIDLTTGAITDKLAPPEWIEEVWLVDPAGKVLLWNGLSPQGPYEPRALPPELAPRLQAQASGWYEGGGRVAAWSTVDALGWRYVLWTNDEVWSHLRTGSY
jgi:serine/threonine protein kinase